MPCAPAAVIAAPEPVVGPEVRQASWWRDWPPDAAALGLALAAVPVSIAIAEIFLGAALLARMIAAARGRCRFRAAPALLPWSICGALQAMLWLHSPDLRAGWGEMRHLLLIAALFLIIPTLDRPAWALRVWRAIFLTAAAGSLVLICKFIARAVRFRQAIATAPDPSFYVRNGGLLHHWMVYGTVEVLVFAALIEFWRLFPGERRWLLPLAIVQGLAILLSLTRMLWIACLAMLALEFLWSHSKRRWWLPVFPALLLLAPGVVRARLVESLHPEFYSNAERIQMLRVGWRMVREHPWTGVGPGRAGTLYPAYLVPSEPLPAYHGHLHNNALQLAAEFGVLVPLALALLVLAIVARLRGMLRSAPGREIEFLCRTALLGLAGFVVAGLFDYTYGHALGIILLGFVILAPLNYQAGTAEAAR